MRILPHRYLFLLVDCIVELEPGKGGRHQAGDRERAALHRSLPALPRPDHARRLVEAPLQTAGWQS